MIYFRFLMERAGGPPPHSICILGHCEEWANRQIVDELSVTWPLAKVFMLGDEKLHSCDLLVVPFDGDSAADAPPLDATFCTNWIMIYGLERRRIWIFRKEMAMSFLASARRFRAARRILAITKLAHPLKTCLRIWKRFLNS
jgi:hypothetical protein